MRLSHNLASLNVYRAYSKVLASQSASMERVSTGLKVKYAKDNPNVIAQSEKIRIQTRGNQMALRNMQDGASMLQTAQGGLDEMTEILQRVRELTVKAGSGTNSPEDKDIIQKEITQLLDGYDNISQNTEFNGKKLLSGNQTLDMQVGANVGESVEVPVKDFSSSNIMDANGKKIGLDALKADGSLNNNNKVDTALELIDSSLDQIISMRSKYGALENRFEGNYEDKSEINLRMEDANSKLTDADIAEEMMNVARTNVLSEAGNAMMVQTNRMPQEILQILQNVK